MRMKDSYPRLSVASTVALLLLSISKGSQAHHCQRLDFGSCASPSIKYGWDIDGSQRYGYLPTNENDFPHGWSPDIATIESFICSRLESPCNAPPDTVQRCRDSFNLYSGLSGDNAVDAWNSAMGSTERDEHDDDDTHCSYADFDQSYLTATTKSSTIETIPTHTRTEVSTTKTHAIPSPSSILTTTLTLPSSPTTTDHPPNSSTLQSSTETQTTIQTTTTTTTDPTSSSSITIASTDSSSPSPSPSPTSNSNSNDGDSGPTGGGGGGSPFSPESAAPTLSVLGNEGPLKLLFLLSLLALLIALWYR